MLVLSRNDIERISNIALKSYLNTDILPLRKICINRFAQEYLGLNIEYIDLDFSPVEILGMTSYEDFELCLDENLPWKTIHMKQNTIYLNRRLLNPKNFGRHNFTIAHECGHQIVYRMEKDNLSKVSSELCSFRRNSENDWNEWQANCFASALLMPEQKIRHYYYLTRSDKPFCIYHKNSMHADTRELIKMSNFFGVSYTALCKRLIQLNLAKMPSHDYINVMDIVKEENEWENISSIQLPASESTVLNRL